MRSSSLLFPLLRISQQFSIFSSLKGEVERAGDVSNPRVFFLSIIVSVVFHLSIPQFCNAAPLPLFL